MSIPPRGPRPVSPAGPGRPAVGPPDLTGYSAKRDFRKTPEPRAVPDPSFGSGSDAGTRANSPPRRFPRFVVQEHHSRRLHWDLRLEADGVLKSWAVPKGIPRTPGEKRLAVQVEDHPLDYIDFEGTIPEGNYGAGEVYVWDRGIYAASAMNERKVTFAALGDRLNGAYKLIRMEGSQWLLMMLADGRASPTPGGPA